MQVAGGTPEVLAAEALEEAAISAEVAVTPVAAALLTRAADILAARAQARRMVRLRPHRLLREQHPDSAVRRRRVRRTFFL